MENETCVNRRCKKSHFQHRKYEVALRPESSLIKVEMIDSVSPTKAKYVRDVIPAQCKQFSDSNLFRTGIKQHVKHQ